MPAKLGYIFALLASFELSGCGLTVPEMNILSARWSCARQSADRTLLFNQWRFSISPYTAYKV